MNQRLYINGDQLDLFENQFIGLTINFQDFNDIEKRKSDVSNIFKIPTTANNLKILGHINKTTISEDLFNRSFICDYFEDDICLIKGGRLTITMASSKSIECRVNATEMNFFQLISANNNIGQLFCNDYNKLLSGDIPYNYQPWFIHYGLEEIDRLWDGQNNWYNYPIISYNKEAATDVFTSSGRIRVQNIRPCLMAKRILERYTDIYGYQFSGEFMTSQEFERLGVLPETMKFYEPMSTLFTPSWGNLYGGLKFPISAPSIPPPINTTAGQNDTVTTILNGSFAGITPPIWEDFNAVENEISIYSRMAINVIGTIRIYVDSLTKKTASLKLKLYERDTVAGVNTEISSYTLYEETRKYRNEPIDFNVTDSYIGWFRFDRIYFFVLEYTRQGIGNSKTFSTEISINIEDKLNWQKSKSGVKAYHVPELMHTTSQVDFFRDFINLFGLLVTVDELSKTVYFNSYNDILKRIPDALELSLDLIKDFEWSPYSNDLGQKTYFKFNADGLNDGLNDGFIEIDNKLISVESTSIELKSGAMIEVNQQGEDFAHLPVSEEWQSEDCAFRFVQLEHPASPSTDWILEDEHGNERQVINDICVGRVYGNYPLTFNRNVNGNLIDRKYQLLDDMFRNYKILTVYMYLNSKNVSEMEITRPIHITSTDNNAYLNGYYMIVKIDKFRKGLNKVTLAKINL